MPIRVRYNNDPNQECTLRPTPLWSVTTNILKTGAGEAFGVNYTITINGTLIHNQGSPYASKQDMSRYDFFAGANPVPNQVGPYSSFDNNVSHFRGATQDRPPKQQIDCDDALQAIIFKQKAIRALFARDGQRLELTDWDDEEASIICYPRVVDVSFAEGIYVNTSTYTITLEADTLLDKDIDVDIEGGLIANHDWAKGVQGIREEEILSSLSGAFISDFSENWTVEVDESFGESPEQPFSYRITRTLNATGKTHYGPVNGDDGDVVKYEAWEQAKKFIGHRLYDHLEPFSDPQNVSGYYPNRNQLDYILGNIGSGSLNLAREYRGYNHVRSESIDQTVGSYGVSDSWVIATGTAYENFSVSINSTNSAPFVSVSVEGTIKGLSDISASGYPIGKVSPASPESIFSSGTPYGNAITKYNEISNTGQFGVTCDIFRRANNSVAVQLNSQPLSVALGTNKYTGEINYTLEFNNRPTNFISGVLNEDIQINDTYPGDVFAVIPVIGRPTGPVLQYIGGRTEYTRDISLDLTLDYTKLPYSSGRNPMVLKKPSVVQPMSNQISDLINQVSPQGEPGVLKYFLNPPREIWNPKQGTYNLSMSWVYELDK